MRFIFKSWKKFRDWFGLPKGVFDLGDKWVCFYADGIYECTFWPGWMPFWIASKIVRVYEADKK